MCESQVVQGQLLVRHIVTSRVEIRIVAVQQALYKLGNFDGGLEVATIASHMIILEAGL